MVLTTESGRDVKMTADHLLFAGACEIEASSSSTSSSSALPLVRAGSLKVNQCVQTLAGRDRIISVSRQTVRGLYSAVTMDGEKFLVVNGIVASPFAFNHAIVNAFYSLHRAFYSVFPSVMLSPFIRTIVDALGGTLLSTLSPSSA